MVPAIMMITLFPFIMVVAYPVFCGGIILVYFDSFPSSTHNCHTTGAFLMSRIVFQRVLMVPASSSPSGE